MNEFTETGMIVYRDKKTGKTTRRVPLFIRIEDADRREELIDDLAKVFGDVLSDQDKKRAATSKV